MELESFGLMKVDEELLIEGYKVTAEENLKILEEFKYVDADMNKYCEWDEDLE